MNLIDSMEKFHNEWKHERKPAIFQIINKVKGPDYTEGDLLNLVWHLHEHWNRLGNAGARWAASTSEIRVIMAKRRERVAEQMKLHDKATAESIMSQLGEIA